MFDTEQRLQEEETVRTAILSEKLFLEKRIFELKNEIERGKRIRARELRKP